MTENWTVYIDETGPFDGSSKPSFVVGWLTQTDGSEKEELLKEKLKDIAPWLPRPLHGSYLRRAAWHGLGLICLQDEFDERWEQQLKMTRDEVFDLSHKLKALWSKTANESFEHCVFSVRHEIEPNYQDIKKLDQILKAAFKPSVELRQVAAAANTAQIQIKNALRSTFTQGLHEDVVVLAGQSSPDDGHEEDRYLKVLETAIRMAAWTVLKHSKADGKAARLQFVVAQRMVYYDNPNEEPRILSHHILKDVFINALNGHQQLHIQNASVQIGERKLEDFRFTEKRGLFVADYAANTLYRRYQRSWREEATLALLNQDVENRLGISLKINEKSPWSAGATGWSHDILEKVRHGDEWSLRGKGIPQWVRTCTQQWATILQQPEWQEAQL